MRRLKILWYKILLLNCDYCIKGLSKRLEQYQRKEMITEVRLRNAIRSKKVRR